MQKLLSSDGGIGRHVGLKNPFLRECEFDSRSEHQFEISIKLQKILFLKALILKKMITIYL